MKAKLPDLVALEWDFKKNSVDPDTIAPHTNKKYYWKCLHGHESYSSRVNNKVNGNGGNCPQCSHQKFSPEFSLQALKPELAKKWDIKANGGITPNQVSAYANKSAWWICQKCGHKWQADIDNRSNGRGCPNCAKGHHTSFPEQAVYYFVHKVFPDAENGYKIEGREIDVYIPSVKIGIEYDGEAFHRSVSKVEKDISKSRFIKKKGIELIRIRENGCSAFDSDSARVIGTTYSSNYDDLQVVLQNLLDELCSRFNIDNTVVVDIKPIRVMLTAMVNTVTYENSLAFYLKEREKAGKPVRAFWDYDEKYPLTPEQVKPFSEMVVAWICPDNPEHKWRNTVKSISLGYGCSKCSKRYHRDTREWINAARAVHGDKYNYEKVVFVNTKTLVTIVCPKHGEFQQAPSEHLSGKGCRFCSHQAFHPLECLAAKSPEVAAQWDYELNKESGFTPETIGIDSVRKFWWHCTNGKPHSFKATIVKRVNGGMQCAVCHGKQMAYDRSVEYLYPELAAEWCPEND